MGEHAFVHISSGDSQYRTAARLLIARWSFRRSSETDLRTSVERLRPGPTKLRFDAVTEALQNLDLQPVICREVVGIDHRKLTKLWKQKKERRPQTSKRRKIGIVPVRVLLGALTRMCSSAPSRLRPRPQRFRSPDQYPALR